MLSSFKSKIGNVFCPIHLWGFSNGVLRVQEFREFKASWFFSAKTDECGIISRTLIRIPRKQLRLLHYKSCKKCIKKGHSTDSFSRSRLLRNHFKNSDWNFKSKDFLYYNRNNVKNRKKSNLTLLVRKSRWLQNSFKNSCRNSNFVYYIRNHSKNAKPAAFFDTKNGMLNFFIRQKQTTAELHISRILIRIWREQVCLLH